MDENKIYPPERFDPNFRIGVPFLSDGHIVVLWYDVECYGEYQSESSCVYRDSKGEIVGCKLYNVSKLKKE